MTTQTIDRPATTPGSPSAAVQIARRVLLRYFRTPGLNILTVMQSVLFLFIFRYVLGGAVVGGTTAYTEFLVPGYVATAVLFSGGGIAVSVAEDRAQGFTERLLSLPVPRYAIVLGRTLADSATNFYSIVMTGLFGFLFGYRLSGSLLDGLAALALCVLYCVVFTLVFIVLGLYAPNVQAAQGLWLISLVLAFLSNAYVPASTMPGWAQPFVKHQPITPMVDAVRALVVGSTSDVGLALVWSAVLLMVFTPIAVLRYRRL
jgi:ABC-2 type transport system permease protein